jgi:hypothetical protein
MLLRFISHCYRWSDSRSQAWQEKCAAETQAFQCAVSVRTSIITRYHLSLRQRIEDVIAKALICTSANEIKNKQVERLYPCQTSRIVYKLSVHRLQNSVDIKHAQLIESMKLAPKKVG